MVHGEARALVLWHFKRINKCILFFDFVSLYSVVSNKLTNQPVQLIVPVALLEFLYFLFRINESLCSQHEGNV